MDDQGAGVAAQPPTELGKNLRCCFGCRLVKAFAQFFEQGCENCPFLAMEGDKERIYDATSTEFSGLISVVDPQGSWGAKWLHLRKSVPGCYALTLHGEPPQHVEDILEANGIKVYTGAS